MEKHFLDETMEGNPTFRPEPWYNPYGDCIVYQVADEAIIAERVDELLTVYTSAVHGRPIGFQIKGIQAIIKRLGLDGLAFQAEENGKEVKRVSIIALLLAAYEEGPQTLGRRRAYTMALQCPADARVIPADDLQPA